jgi:hypothetical protein
MLKLELKRAFQQRFWGSRKRRASVALGCVKYFRSGILLDIDLQRLVDQEHARRWNIHHLFEMVADRDEMFFVYSKDGRGIGNGHDDFSCVIKKNAPTSSGHLVYLVGLNLLLFT